MQVTLYEHARWKNRLRLGSNRHSPYRQTVKPHPKVLPCLAPSIRTLIVSNDIDITPRQTDTHVGEMQLGELRVHIIEEGICEETSDQTCCGTQQGQEGMREVITRVGRTCCS